MKVVVATDSFKGSLKAEKACEIIAEAIHECIRNIEIVIKPMADGGEGTADAMIKACNGRWVERKVTGPLPGMKVDAGFAWFEDKTALVETASASGLELLRPEQMNPLRTTTYGTGELIKAALEYGAGKVLLAAGGSATVDGGLGATSALGWKFLDSKGRQIPPGGDGPGRLTKIIRPEKINPVPVEVLCDCDNPLCGEFGAAKVYAPQKGATPAMVEQLDNALSNMADVIQTQLGRDIRDIPGAGAAGGLAAGAVAFMNAKLVSGIETIIARTSLRAELESADWVITGEGCFDYQSLSGKVVSGILKIATQTQTRVAVLAGRVELSERQYQKAGIAAAIAAGPDNISDVEAIANSRTLLRTAAKKFAYKYLSQ